MRALKGRRTLLGVASATVAAGVVTAVILVATASSHAEPTRAQYLAGVAAICRVYGPKLDRIRPPDVAEPANVIAAVDRVLPLVTAQLGRVRTLEPPREQLAAPLTLAARARAAARFAAGSLAGLAFVPIALVMTLRARLERR